MHFGSFLRDTFRGRGRRLQRVAWIVVAALLLGGVQARQAYEEARLQKIYDKPIPGAEFASIIRDFSEEGGYFRSDNFVSNETSYLHIVDKLKELGGTGGAYIGVGPEQNFTYIAKVRPRIAFIVDIRRQAMIQHLIYKAIFHLADTRAKYLSLLFSKPIVGSGPGPDASAEDLVRYFSTAPTDGAAFKRNLMLIANTITRNFQVPMAEDDHAMLEYVYSTFRDENLNLQYRSGGFGRYGFGFRGPWGNFPTLSDLILSTDLHGKLGNFLAGPSD